MARRRSLFSFERAFMCGLIYFFIFYRSFGFSWDYFIASYFLGAITEYAYTRRGVNRFDRIGAWLWPVDTIYQTDFEDNSHGDYKLSIASSIFPSVRDAFLKPFGIDVNELREVRDGGSMQSLADRGFLSTFKGLLRGSSQQTIQLPPPPGEYEELDDIELVVGINLRSRVKYKAFCVLKNDSRGLAGKGYCTQRFTRRGALRYYVHIYGAVYLGTHHVQGYGPIQLFMGRAGENQVMPPKLKGDFSAFARFMLVAKPKLVELEMKVKDFGRVEEERDFYKARSEMYFKQYGDMLWQNETIQRQFVKAGLPLPQESLQRKALGLKIEKEVRKVDYRYLALLGISGAVSYVAFDYLTKPAVLGAYPFLSQPAVALLCIAIFGLICYIGRRKFL